MGSGQSQKELDDFVHRVHIVSTAGHAPDRPAYARAHGRGAAKWSCTGCDYWTGFRSRTKANRMILEHINTKNAESAAAEGSPYVVCDRLLDAETNEHCEYDGYPLVDDGRWQCPGCGTLRKLAASE